MGITNNGQQRSQLVHYLGVNMKFVLLLLILLPSTVQAGNEAIITRRLQITTVCSSTPCTIASQTGNWFTSVTRASAGRYSITSMSGFPSAPVCIFQARTVSVYMYGTCGTGSCSISADNAAGTATDTDFVVLCVGTR